MDDKETDDKETPIVGGGSAGDWTSENCVSVWHSYGFFFFFEHYYYELNWCQSTYTYIYIFSVTFNHTFACAKVMNKCV